MMPSRRVTSTILYRVRYRAKEDLWVLENHSFGVGDSSYQYEEASTKRLLMKKAKRRVKKDLKDIRANPDWSRTYDRILLVEHYKDRGDLSVFREREYTVKQK